MKKFTLALAAFGLASVAYAQNPIDTGKWYHLETLITASPRGGAVIGVVTEGNMSECITKSVTDQATLTYLWAQNKAAAGSDNYDWQLWRFEEDPNNPGQYAMICKGVEGSVNPTPTALNANAARWAYQSTVAYGFMPHPDYEVRTEEDGNYAIEITSAPLYEANMQRHMNFAAAGQNYSINTNVQENDYQSNYIKLVPVADYGTPGPDPDPDPDPVDFGPNPNNVDLSTAKYIAVAGAAARNKGHYVGASAEGALYHNNDINTYALWTIGDVAEDGSATIMNVATGKYFTGATALVDEETVTYVYDSPEVAGAVGFNPSAGCNVTSNYNFFNALNTGTGVGTWNLDAGSSFMMLAYVEGDDDAAVQARLNDAMAKPAAIENLAKYFRSSYTGATKLDEVAERVYAATDLAAITEQLMDEAVEYMQADMAAGFAWKNNRNGFYVNYTGGDIPYNRGTMSLNSYWVAEFDDTDVVGINHAFCLKNVASNTYVGVQTTNSQAIPAVEADDAALIKLVVGNGGFEFIITNSGVANNYINMSGNAADIKLVVWNYANDEGGFWSANALDLPMLGEEQPVSVALTGTTEDNEGEEVLTSISAIEITTPAGATVTPLASVKVTLEGQTVYEGNLSDAVANEDKTLYTVAVSPVLNAEGLYTVEVSEYAFEVEKFVVDPDDDENFLPDGYAYSPAVSAEATVTKVASSIAEITGADDAPAAIYDLQGRKLAAPVKGICIINGVKTVVK